jgi:CO/xanthine dehydrogenase FAD-binding subunit
LIKAASRLTQSPAHWRTSALARQSLPAVEQWATAGDFGMKPPPFDYLRAENVGDAVRALAHAGGDAKIIAGGQSLVPMLNFRLLKPSILVDINAISDLSFIADDGDTVRIGALTRHRQLETSTLIAQHFPVISEAMRYVAHLAIRNRGTIGGSLAHADPAAELPMLALLLDAALQTVSSKGPRNMAAHDFFLGALTVDLKDDELLTEIRIPKLPPSSGWGFAEVSRRSGDFALASVAATLSIIGGNISNARIAMGGVDDKPQRAADAEALLMGQRVTPALLRQVSEAAREAVTPNTDVHASADYRRHLVGVLTEQVVSAAWWRATGAAA